MRVHIKSYTELAADLRVAALARYLAGATAHTCRGDTITAALLADPDARCRDLALARLSDATLSCPACQAPKVVGDNEPTPWSGSVTPPGMVLS